MGIVWFGLKEKEGIASFYGNNITLNTVASYPLNEAYRVQVGLDDSKRLLIVPVTKAKAESGIYDEYALLPYEVRRSFSRINSVSLMKQIENALGMKFGKNPAKFKTTWDPKENILYVDMSQEVA
ncbi:MAG: hypothetical protein K6E59_02265 [Bacilli bacterium]|nr:hypothetical protein [Bacilli bacterium]